jgi:TatD DNase family protein
VDQETAKTLPLKFAVASYVDDRGKSAVLGSYERGDRLWHELSEDPRLRLSFGIHPKYCRRNDMLWLEQSIKQLQKLMKLPLVVALGEVGLDYERCSRDQADKQLRALECILREMLPGIGRLPIVFHLRDGEDLKRSSDGDIIQLLQKLVREERMSHDHPIQLHFFHGSKALVERWCAAFPAVHFSMSGSVQHFRQGEREGLRAIPNNKLLLETDAPHARMSQAKGRHWSMPNDVHYVAAEVAKIREVRSTDLLTMCNRNALQFFGLQ